MSAVASDAACIEFTQHAWRPELCVNCQRPRNEHSSVTKPTSASARIVISQSKPHEAVITAKEADSSPAPNKRVSTLPRQSKTAPAHTAQSTPKSTEKPSDNGTAKEIMQQKQDGVKKTGWKESKNQWEQDIELNSHNQSEKSGEVHNKSQSNQGSDAKQSQPVDEGKKYSEESRKSDPPRGILSRKSSDSRKKTEEKPSSRVAFIDSSPHIIGYDGGVGSVFDDNDDEISHEGEDTFSSSSSEGSFSLTDEEKSFALLSLKNTVWNSDTENLLNNKANASGSHRHSSREFEDLSLDALCFSRRFQNLRDCDATKHFGTFPLRKRSGSTKQALDSVFSDSIRPSAADLDTSRLSSIDLDPLKDSESSGSESYKCSHSSQMNSSTAGHVKMRPTVTESSTPAYKVVNIVDGGSRDSYTVTDITSCLYDASQSRRQDSDSVSENSGNSSGKGHASSSESNSPTHVKVRGRSRPTAIRVSTVERQASPQRDSSAEKGEGDYDPLNDSTTAAGLQVLALLNDVLDNYGDNESSTDDHIDFRAEDADDHEKGLGKKPTDFEARMASVAANLDLSKQQRAKRPAPRPPRSPPPEPSVSPKKKTQNQPEPVFKMVQMGKAIMPVPPSHDVPKSLTSGPHGQGLPSFDDLPEGEGDRGNGDAGRTKKGITSFFKNILRRGRDSSESLESSNPEVQFVIRSEAGSSSAPTLTDTGSDVLHKKGSDSASGQSKFRVLPPGAATAVKGGSASTGDLPGSGVKRTVDGEGSSDMLTQSNQDKVSSPPSQTKSKGLSSPKQMLRRTAAKLSPPTQHKALSHTKDEASASAARTKASMTSRKSDDKDASETSSQPTPVRRRAKSPKRIPPPAPPARPHGGGKGEDGWSADLTRELEQRLKPPGASASAPNIAPPVATKPAPQTAAAKSVSQTLKPDSPSPTSRAEIRKSMTVPPPSPPTSKVAQVSRSPPTSPTPEESDSQPGSPTDDLSNSDDSPRFMEKIELPTAAPGKKGILGKLNMNRKSRAPAPPLSVKRARSISDAEKRTKRINPADISGPVVGCLFFPFLFSLQALVILCQ